MIKTKSVYSTIDRRCDGLRVLATRIRGRGLHASRYNIWMANLGPSEKLLDAIRSERINWQAAQCAKPLRARSKMHKKEDLTKAERGNCLPGMQEARA